MPFRSHVISSDGKVEKVNRELFSFEGSHLADNRLRWELLVLQSDPIAICVGKYCGSEQLFVLLKEEVKTTQTSKTANKRRRIEIRKDRGAFTSE